MERATGRLSRALPYPGVVNAGGSGLQVTRMVLCGGAAPPEYWTAPRRTGCEYLLIHHPGDKLCALNLGATGRGRSAFRGIRVIRVNVPDGKLAAEEGGNVDAL